MTAKRLAAGVVFLAALLLLGASSARAEETQIEFKSSLDASAQKAMAYVPDACKAKESPLLVVAHYMGADRHGAKGLGYYAEADKRGWLVVCPDLHGHRTAGRTSLASIEAQHDVIDSISFMESRYRVDRSRIYLAGRSMGGMLAEIMAAKYPDRFACVVAGQGISDLVDWSRSAPPELRDLVKEECLDLSDQTRFDYERRSAIRYAPNFHYVPLIVWHGSNDAVVPSEQSERLVEAIRKYYPRQEAVHWLQGAGHMGVGFPARWVCDQLEYYVNTCDGSMKARTRFYPELSLVVDEPREIFWLTIEPAGEATFAEVSAAIKDNTLTIKTARTRRVAVQIEKIVAGLSFSCVVATSDGPTALAICRGDKQLFGMTCEKKKSADVPAEIWTQPNLAGN